MPPTGPDKEEEERLEAAIAAQEALRPSLGDAVVDTAIATLRAKLRDLRSPAADTPSPDQPGEIPAEAPGRYTVLFADLEGFTAISEGLDPDEVREFLNDLMLDLCEAVEQHGGLVVKFLGDAVVAVFHGDAAEESALDDAERALLAALLMEARVRVLDGDWRQRLGRPVRLHMGLESGGSRGVGGITQGEAIAAATRLQQAAGPGEILVGPQAYSLARHGFHFQPSADSRSFLLRAPGSLAAAPAAAVERRAEGGTGPADLFHDAELRQVTVLFADLAEPARVRRALRSDELEAFEQDLMHALSDGAARYGATVERIFGHAVMAVFGAPVAHEDDPERAVRSAVLMQELAEGMNRRWQSRVGGPIRLQIGINTGTVVAGGILLGTDRAYAVTGDTLNTAARLRSAAEPGEVLLGPDTARLVAHAAETEPLAPLTLKGKARPVAVHRLQALRRVSEAARGLHQRGIASPLVGRDAETAAISAVLSRAAEGRGGVLAVTGDPGLGKSRLFAEMRAEGEAAGLLWLEGRTLSYSAELSYWPFLQVLRQAAGIREGDDESAAWSALERRLRALFGGDIAEPLAYLATMMGFEITGELAERVRHLDADALRRQILRAARRLFERLARERPVVLFLEDIHWMDASSAALAEHLLPLTGEVPLLLCWASRPDDGTGDRLGEAARAEHGERFTEIRLQPLPREASDLLLRNLLENALPRSVRSAILDKADGNPFFVEEVIRGMIDCGAVTQDRSGAWRATPEAERMSIPDTVQGVIMARIDRLDDDLKRLLRLASVIGRSFLLRILKAIAEGDRAIEAGVEELTGLELVREKQRTPELEYIFRHALVQETTYETLVRRRRRELHRRVAECIETLFATRLEEFYGLLAFHAARAEDWERAQRYLLRAGDQAARIAADAEALAHYQHAIDACERAFGDRWEPAERAALDRRIGEALFRRGDFPAAARFLTGSLARFGRKYPSTRAGIRGAIVRQVLRQIGHRRLPSLFLRGADAKGAGRECAETYALLGWINYTVSHEHLVHDALCTLNEAERAGDPVSTCRGLMAVGVLLGALSLHGLAGRYQREAVRVGEQHGQRVALGQAYLGLGMHHYDTGDWDECAQVMEQARTTYMEAGDLRGWGAAGAWIFWIAVYRGEFETALEIAEGMARYGDETGDGQLSRFGLHYRGAALSRRGDLKGAVTALEGAVERYRAVPEVIGMAHAAGDLGRCYARLGDLSRARILLEDANRQLDERGLSAGGCVPPRSALAEVLLQAAEAEKGDERRALLRQARRAAGVCLRLGRLHHESLLFGYQAAGTCDWLEGRPQAARAKWRRALGLAEALGARYEIARMLKETARHTGDASAAARAAELFSRIAVIPGP